MVSGCGKISFLKYFGIHFTADKDREGWKPLWYYSLTSFCEVCY